MDGASPEEAGGVAVARMISTRGRGRGGDGVAVAVLVAGIGWCRPHGCRSDGLGVLLGRYDDGVGFRRLSKGVGDFGVSLGRASSAAT